MTEQIFYAIDTVSTGGQEVLDEVDIFVQNDPYGLLMALLGMGIVFLVLLILYIVFSNTSYLLSPEFSKKLKEFFSKRRTQEPQAPEVPVSSSRDLSGEVNAAIAAALHLYRSELHDYENTVLTINKVSRTYSPWSSKIYGLRNVMNKK